MLIKGMLLLFTFRSLYVFREVKLMNSNMLNKSLRAIRGQFTPTSMGARVFMNNDELEEPENFLVLFHEKFHYFQMIFTPYGQLKWGCYRTNSIDIINTWVNLTDKLITPKKIPIKEYLNDETEEGVKIAYNIALQDLMFKIYSAIEYGPNTLEKKYFPSINDSSMCPVIFLDGEKYSFRVIDILESFAKFEEAMLGELITENNLDELIDPDRLNPEYYSALYYFIEQVGVERLIEFPIVCELALMSAHIPSPTSVELLKKYAPNWRFIKIIEVIKDSSNLPDIDIYDDESFCKYYEYVLNKCDYENIIDSWKAASKYANSSDLTMSIEMQRAIDYKMAHPWVLAYPMRSFTEFTSDEFNSFLPYFTITENGVFYNTQYIKNEEIILENHLQALAQQICGHVSKYCQDSFKLMCGYTYMGTLTCPHYLNGDCDGYIDEESHLPDLRLDEKSNILSGCTFEMFLNLNGLSIENIIIGMMSYVDFDEVVKSAENILSNLNVTNSRYKK